MDLVCQPLEPVVVRCGVGVVGLADQHVHDPSDFLVSGVLVESSFQLQWVKVVETFHAWAVFHDADHSHYLGLVLPHELQPRSQQELEMLSDIRFKAFHELNVVLSKLKGSLLEP